MAGVRFEGVTKRFDDGTVAVEDLWLEVSDGEFMILVGPSGCGKTTVLRMLAGFEQATSGRIMLGDRLVNDVEPAERDVAMVFQNFALFPHMSVRDNIAFPLRMRGVSKKEIPGRVEEIAQLLEIGNLLSRMPHELSGGQRQRVAMGRVIVRHPQTFLMDEPLSSLDAKLRSQMRTELVRLHQRLGVTTIYVTHDHTEAMTLGTRIAVMRDGVVQQVGPPRELYRNPANVFVARFIGTPPMNLMQGSLAEGRVEIAGATVSGTIDAHAHLRNGPIVAGIRPHDWRLEEGTGPEVVVRGVIDVVEDFGSEMIVHFKPEAAAADVVADEEDEDATVFTACVTGRDPQPGDRVELHAHVTALHLFDAADGVALELNDAAPGPAHVA